MTYKTTIILHTDVSTKHNVHINFISLSREMFACLFVFYLMATQRQHHLTSTNIKFERYYRFTDNAWTHGHGIQITYPIIKNSPQSLSLLHISEPTRPP